MSGSGLSLNKWEEASATGSDRQPAADRSHRKCRGVHRGAKCLQGRPAATGRCSVAHRPCSYTDKSTSSTESSWTGPERLRVWPDLARPGERGAHAVAHCQAGRGGRQWRRGTSRRRAGRGSFFRSPWRSASAGQCLVARRPRLCGPGTGPTLTPARGACCSASRDHGARWLPVGEGRFIGWRAPGVAIQPVGASPSPARDRLRAPALEATAVTTADRRRRRCSAAASSAAAVRRGRRARAATPPRACSGMTTDDCRRRTPLPKEGAARICARSPVRGSAGLRVRRRHTLASGRRRARAGRGGRKSDLGLPDGPDQRPGHRRGRSPGGIMGGGRRRAGWRRAGARPPGSSERLLSVGGSRRRRGVRRRRPTRALGGSRRIRTCRGGDEGGPGRRAGQPLPRPSTSVRWDRGRGSAVG